MAKWERDTPWRQGSILDPDTAARLQIESSVPLDQAAIVVITHDCDLAQSPKVEPEIEAIVGQFIDGRPDGNYTECKNLRRLHLESTDGTTTRVIQLDAGERIRLKKEVLDNSAESLAIDRPWAAYHLPPRERDILQRWLAARYRRAAFPDEFDRRLKRETSIASKLGKLFKTSGTFITAVFFDVDCGEEHHRDGADDPYELRITLVFATDKDPAAAVIAAEAAEVAIRQLFLDECSVSRGGVVQAQWIELVDVEVMSDHTLTYAQSQQYRKWHADHISLRTDPVQPILEG